MSKTVNVLFNILFVGNTNKLPQNNPFALQQLRQSSSHSESTKYKLNEYIVYMSYII